jgi:hypothetical protein
MSFYIVNTETGQRTGFYSWLAKRYDTERGAKGACTRMNKAAVAAGKEPVFTVMDAATFKAPPVKMVERVNLMSGQKYMEAEDTPNFLSPASEAYWSM